MPQSRSTVTIDNPYDNIDWNACQYVDSMSHQHSIANGEECEIFYKMGYRHFAFSCYYPSVPVVSLPEEFAERHPDVINSPNAEHHSFIDTSLHLNGLGSYFSSGYGQTALSSDLSAAPAIVHFDDIGLSNEASSIYRLDIALEAKQDTHEHAKLWVEGATKCGSDDEIRNIPIDAGRHQIYVSAQKGKITVTLDYDDRLFRLTQLRLMQGTNRPWREVFRDVLNNLKYADGGGITLNHPAENADHYLPMLDFDPGVLGTEVWNDRRGFGKALHFYRVWDDILSTGRRCWGFFVKDHYAYGKGRNILLLSKSDEHSALQAYRKGTFYGSIAAPVVDDDGNVTTSFDKSSFRFTRIAVRRNEDRRPIAIEVSVAGQDVARRPNVQIRFITANGIEKIADTSSAEFLLPVDDESLLALHYVRVEAFAYPASDGEGVPLTNSSLGQMDVGQIVALHRNVNQGQLIRSPERPVLAEKDRPWNAIGEPGLVGDTASVADMIFSQPVRFLAASLHHL